VIRIGARRRLDQDGDDVVLLGPQKSQVKEAEAEGRPFHRPLVLSALLALALRHCCDASSRYSSYEVWSHGTTTHVVVNRVECDL
jgi:hypothetical protein